MKNDANFHRILVPVDFSDVSLKAILIAMRLGTDQATELHLVHAYQPMAIYAGGGMMTPPVANPTEVPDKHRLENDLANVPIPDFKEAQVKRELIEGSPASAIVEYAAKNDIDLIVMTTHGTTGLTRLIMGSVAEHVVRKAECPVLTLKASVAA